jgi:hypothetical protein
MAPGKVRFAISKTGTGFADAKLSGGQKPVPAARVARYVRMTEEARVARYVRMTKGAHVGRFLRMDERSSRHSLCVR